ncbi:MAG: nucleotidyl transferase AbiEii/AbiGii toxin family protein [Bdellovibrionaceae bacterium]|nr:nucleotidyl transferase AbiEii/AbiGii toxin family protein [Pseudobdellovibrionaceae bacterium]
MSREVRANKIRVELTRLANSGDTFSVNELRILLALERIVARLTADKTLDKHLVYKGGFVLMKVLESERFTRDLDALGVGIDKNDMIELVPRTLEKDLGDGLWFGDIQVESLDAQGEYGAVRFDAAFQIGRPAEKSIGKLSRIHFDVGFGDKIPAKLKPLESPSLLPSEKPVSWKVYPPEYIFSEKLQTLVARGNANSRAKDVYDLVLLFGRCANHAELKKAVEATFATRETPIPLSFHEMAKGLSVRQIEHSWKSVQLETTDLDFQTAWGDLLEMLRDFDAVMVGFGA